MSLRVQALLSAVVLVAGGVLTSKAQAQAQAPAAQAETSTFSLWPKWGPFIDLQGMVGTQRDIGEVSLFVPMWQDDRSMLFGNAIFKADNQNSREGNFGLGFRKMLADGWNAGVYGFYDDRLSPNANLFNQLTFGVELLGTNFDFRANSYWPVGNTVQPVGSATTGPTTVSISGASLQVFTPATMQTLEYALRGFDAEAGVRIPITPAESPYNLRFYAGGYRFDDPTGTATVIAGPRLRLEFTDYFVPGLWNGTRFTVGGEWQTDQVRGSQFFAGLRLRIPLQGESRRANFTMQERRMTDAVVRDVDIVANTRNVAISPAITEAATATTNGQTITVLTAANTTGANLPTAVANAGANSTVILSGNFTTNSSNAGVVTLNSGQTLMGRGTLSLRTASGRTVTATLSNSASITGNVGSSNWTVVTANNSTVTGLTINNTDATGNNALGIKASGVSGVTISNNVINVTQTGGGTAHGIDVISGSSNVIVSNNSVTSQSNGANSGIGIQVNGAGATLNGNTLSVTAPGTAKAVVLSNATIGTGSTGNVKSAGSCSTSGTNTGTVFFTDGTTCP
ncbi:MAG: inverse autotransporter beta domain-containing protein [Proteobacteria bacterium]|nr:inverse autotransporter beta domain-containing protein [Pseudomonadota bacterium]